MRLWVIAGYKEPIVEERFGGGQPNRTVLTLPLVGKEDLDVIKKQPEKQPENESRTKKAEEIEERMRSVLEIIKGNPGISRSAISKQLQITDMQVRTAIDKLKNNGKLQREGSDKKGKWIISETKE